MSLRANTCGAEGAWASRSCGPAGLNGLRLHFDARRARLVAFGVMLLGLVSGFAAEWLSSSSAFDGPVARTPVVVLSPCVAAILASLTLAGADVDLDRSVAVLRPKERVIHALVVSAMITLSLALSALTEPLLWGSLALIRNSIGLMGLVLLSASKLPAPLVWSPALVYVLSVYTIAPSDGSAGSKWWAWPLQSGSLDASWMSAALLFATGLMTYGLHGPAPRT